MCIRDSFYNWYDTRTLHTLAPLYVSSVDSGNLAGHLLTHGAGLQELVDERIFSPQVFAGLRDTIGILRSLGASSPVLAELDGELTDAPASLSEAAALLERVTDHATKVAAALANETDELKGWARALGQSCQEHRDDLHLMAPWLSLPATPPGLAGLHAGADGAVSRQARSDQGLPASAATKLGEKIDWLDKAPTLREISTLDQSVCPLIDEALGDSTLRQSQPGDGEGAWLAELSRCVREASEGARQRMLALEKLAQQSNEMAEMDFTFLADPERNLLAVGFNVTDRRRDTSFYDLLASESRLGSYVAIAQGQVPQNHWFSLGRLLVPSPRGPILVSWSGSMFEYLMPLLVMPSYANTLLEHTCRAVVHQQIEYGRLRGVPWGISESCLLYTSRCV